MNKVYKVIYSKARQCYIVVSELARNHHKSVSSSGAVVGSNKLSRLLIAALAAGAVTFGSYGTVMAAGPAATQQGPGSEADGIGSIAVGTFDKVVSTKSDATTYQGATSLAVGTLNTIDADATSGAFDGVANSIVGQVNYTKNANAAIIVGAGNKVTHSYQDVSGLDQDTISKIMGYYQAGQMDKVTEILQKAVPNSGGQVLAIGGGNTVDYAQSSQVMGVSNTLKGTEKSISKYNLVDGFQNNVTNAQNTYVVGTKNTLTNTQNTIALGDDRSLNGVKGAVVIGSADKTLTTDQNNVTIIGYNANATGADALATGMGALAEADHSIAIGTNAHTQDSNGKKGSGDIAIGYGAHTNNYADQSGSIAMGQNAFAENMTGQQEAAFAFGQTSYSGSTFSAVRIPADPSKVPGGMAIGQNTYVRTGGLMVGTHNYKGKLGDVEVDSSNSGSNSKNVFTTTLGTNSFNSGAFSTITGAYSIASSNYNGGRSGYLQAGKNFGATIMGSLNSIESSTASSNYSGVANSIVGTANRTFNSNGSLIFGAGNEITNSVTTISAPSDGGDSAQSLQQTLMEKVKSSNAGGATLAIGGGNKADYTQQSQLLGVGNTLTGTSSSISKYNMLDGYKNTATNVSNTKIIGSNNTVNDKADSNTIVGDNHTIVAEKTNNVILGNADTDAAKTTSASDAVIIGHNASVSVDGGVALGSGSRVVDSDKSSVDLKKYGYGYEKQNSDDQNYYWQSDLASISVGSSGHTRRITNVAAGIDPTDAVNVAQLRSAMSNAGSKINLIAGDGIKIDAKDGNYTISANITGSETDTDKTTVTPKDSSTGTSDNTGTTGNMGSDSASTGTASGTTDTSDSDGNTDKTATDTSDKGSSAAGSSSTDKTTTDNSGNGKQLIVKTETNPTNFAADEGTAAAVKPSETLTINGDKTNIATKVEGKAISVKLKDDINVKTVTATDSIGIKNGPTMTTDGINAANKKITNVAAGTAKTDAVNYGQLKDVESKVDSNAQNITNVNGRVNDLDSKVNKVGAGAAALAALHPLDFDPDDKWDFAVGYGNYRDANSVAVGAFYRPDEDTMFSLGTNFGNGENMINAGVSFKFGQKGKTSNNRLVINKEVTELRATVSRQDEQLKKQDSEIKELKAMVSKLLADKENKAEAAK